MTRLALVMIARDERRAIARALASARPHVERLIVLDTGSTDGTPQIAAEAGAEVAHFTWCDDFAAARNAALDLSDADWNLVLDADEWIDGGEAALGPQVLAPGAGDFLGSVQVASEIGEGAERSTSRAWIARVLPRGVRYAGRIHEQPASTLPLRRLPLVIAHDGYLPDNLERKGARNETLLMAELEASPEDAYLWFQLGKEHQVRERPPQAAVCFSEALRLAGPEAPFRHALVVRALTALKTAERFDEALALLDAEFPNWQASPDFFFAMGDLYLAWAGRNPDKALQEFLPLAEFAWKKCLEIGERPDLDGAVAGRGGHMPAHNLAVMYGTLGLADLARDYEALAARLRAA
ncbi:glycosyltransferase [Caulobacter sp. KR2-114]|uniref:glycosyltransferase n=1 Tax=Caulobacter sp. KR2-114 TaxID=3400912 RepID=UPI003C047B95